MKKESIKLTTEELRDVVFGDSENYNVIKSETTGHWRHGSEETTIVQRISDNKYFKIDWRDSIKDECMFKDMNCDGVYIEVFPKTIEIVIYE